MTGEEFQRERLSGTGERVRKTVTAGFMTLTADTDRAISDRHSANRTGFPWARFWPFDLTTLPLSSRAAAPTPKVKMTADALPTNRAISSWLPLEASSSVTRI